MKLFTQRRKNDGTYAEKLRWKDAGAGLLLSFCAVGTLVGAAQARQPERLQGGVIHDSKSLAVLTVGNEIDAESTQRVIESDFGKGEGPEICLEGETLRCFQNSRVMKEWLAFEKREAGAAGVLRSVCTVAGFTGDSCPRTLYGMAMTESGMRWDAVGDSGKSFGFFQIHLGYHPDIPKSCARDLACSAKWTLNRLVAKGWPKAADKAVMAHNGTPGTKATKAYLAKVKAKSNSWK